MNVLIIEPLWQHTEVIGCWLDYFSTRNHVNTITIYYPNYNKNQHNYIKIWEKMFNFTLLLENSFNNNTQDIVLINTASLDLLRTLAVFFNSSKIIAIEHYAVQTIRGRLTSAENLQICDIPVQPFSDPDNMVLPICQRLADLLLPCRLDVPNSRKIIIIGNSFTSMPTELFTQFINTLQAANYTITIVLYGYNDTSSYAFSNSIIIKKDISAIDLYAEIESARFILFIPGVHHYCNQGSGALVHSLQFGRPLITFDNYLNLYNLHTHYIIGSANLITQMDDDEYYKIAQQHLQVRLNEILGKNKQILESKIGRFLQVE